MGDGWVFERTYPTKWKAKLALEVWRDSGKVSDYWAAARKRQEERRKARDRSPAEPKRSREQTPASRVAQDRDVLETLAQAGSLSLSAWDRELLGSLAADVAGLTEREQDRLHQVYRGLARGFFHLAARGHEFVPPSEVQRRLGASIESNYRGAGGSFLQFATAYWTLKISLSRKADRADEGTIGKAVLQKLEEEIAGVFFPTPGPFKIPVKQREAMQRSLFATYQVPINIEEFIARNPIPQGGQKQKAGCGAALLILGGLIGGAALL